MPDFRPLEQITWPEWAERVAAVIQQLEELAAWERALPPWPQLVTGEMDGLLQAWQDLGMSPSVVNPVTWRAGVSNDRLTRGAKAAATRFREWLANLERGIANRLKAGSQGVQHLAVLTADFRESVGVYTLTDETHGEQRTLVAGSWHALYESHDLRRVLSSDDCLQMNSQPVVLLGSPNYDELYSSHIPKPFYLIAPAVELTKRWRGYQVEKVKREREAREREQAQQQAVYARDPSRQVDALARRVALLEKQLAETAEPVTVPRPSLEGVKGT
jgi:hypothetical protein